MKDRVGYAVESLELHLFFARIMKEHSLFLKAGFTPVDSEFARRAEYYKNEFENLLLRCVKLSNGMIRENVLHSGELVTEFTLCAEKQTEQFTGIAINTQITFLESRLNCGKNPCISAELAGQIRGINQNALCLLNGLIELKQSILKQVLCCKMFTMNYPLLIEHILREAKLYHTYVVCLENGTGCDCQTMREMERFWNQIMMEHAMFIRGLLDPTENELIRASNDFARDYARLLTESRERTEQTMSLDETLKFRDFKAAGAKGIQRCEIKSVILPLLADHVLREANHYIRLLSADHC